MPVGAGKVVSSPLPTMINPTAPIFDNYNKNRRRSSVSSAGTFFQNSTPTSSSNVGVSSTHSTPDKDKNEKTSANPSPSQTNGGAAVMFPTSPNSSGVGISLTPNKDNKNSRSPSPSKTNGADNMD